MTTASIGPRTVIVMAKEPVAGMVKTRLCPPCTPDEAADLAQAALSDTLEAVGRTTADRRVLVLDGQPGACVPDGFEILAQRGGRFAERLEAAWLETIGGRPGPTVQIGMDTPQVTPELLDDALDRLDHVASAVGLAEDGGWWALGLRAYRRGLFAGVPMSTPETGRRQERRIRELLGTAPDRLPFLRDVDHFVDARHVAELAPRTRFARRLASIDHQADGQARIST